MTTVLPDEDVNELDNDEEEFAHIIYTPGESAETKILEARVNGTLLTALCGKKFTPKRDPEKFPICYPCREVLAQNEDQR